MQEYEEIKRIGKGAFSEIFLCRYKETGQKVANKRIDMEFYSDEERSLVYAESKTMDRFGRSSHPHVVIYIEHFQRNYVFHFFMQYCSGGTLKREIEKRKTKQKQYKELKVASYLYQVASGLAFIHAKTVVHRHLRPAKILKTGNGVLKIFDYGVGDVLARCNSRTKMEADAVVYMAPEVIRDEECSFACDMWSLGVIAYEMLTLRFPFKSKRNSKLFVKIVEKQFKPIEREVDAQLHEMCAQLLSKEASVRPASQSLSEMGYLLDAFQKSRELELSGEKKTRKSDSAAAGCGSPSVKREMATVTEVPAQMTAEKAAAKREALEKAASEKATAKQQKAEKAAAKKASAENAAIEKAKKQSEKVLARQMSAEKLVAKKVASEKGAATTADAEKEIGAQNGVGPVMGQLQDDTVLQVENSMQ